MQGEKHPMFGKKLSEERKKQNSEYMKNNYKFSEDQKAKISIAKSGKNHHMFDKNEYKFAHDNGEFFSGTQFDFRNKFNLSQSAVSGLITKKRKSSVKGWKLKGNADAPPE